MKVALVGTSVNLTENEERDMRQYIALVLKGYSTSDTTIISGGAKGVDSIALEVAHGLGFKTKAYSPEKEEWEFYKKRNLKIATQCNELHCFSIPVRNTMCYHHDKPMKHEKTAGCWTARKALAMNKLCQLVVVFPRN